MIGESPDTRTGSLLYLRHLIFDFHIAEAQGVRAMLNQAHEIELIVPESDYLA